MTQQPAQGATMQPQKTALALAVNRAKQNNRNPFANIPGMNAFFGTDDKRKQAWRDYGFPDHLGFWDFKSLYDRDGLAHAIVNRIAEKTWQNDPWVIEGEVKNESDPETSWEREFKSLAKRLDLWSKFQDADVKRMVGRYSALILQVADGQDWDTELANGGRLVNVIPVWEGQLTPTEFDDDTTSESYGDPIMWSYQEASVKSGDQTTPGRVVTIHASRVVIIGSYREGVPLLQSAYNDFVSLGKVLGALGEGYWKNAARQLAVSYDKTTTPESLASFAGVPVADLSDGLNGMFRDLNDGLDAGMVNFGGSVTPLVAQLPPPKEPADVLRQNICASVRYPTRMVVGNETGERSSTEDERNANNRCMGRRNGEINQDIRRFVGRLMQYGLINRIAEYTVMWDDLNEASLSDKLDNMGKAAKVVKELMGTGMRGFTEDELRALIGYLPLEELDLPDDNLGGEDD